MFHEFPKWLYHRDRPAGLIVQNQDEADRLGPGWKESPTDLFAASPKTIDIKHVTVVENATLALPSPEPAPLSEPEPEPEAEEAEQEELDEEEEAEESGSENPAEPTKKKSRKRTRKSK